jgi:hypothetical protein
LINHWLLLCQIGLFRRVIAVVNNWPPTAVACLSRSSDSDVVDDLFYQSAGERSQPAGAAAFPSEAVVAFVKAIIYPVIYRSAWLQPIMSIPIR